MKYGGNHLWCGESLSCKLLKSIAGGRVSPCSLCS